MQTSSKPSTPTGQWEVAGHLKHLKLKSGKEGQKKIPNSSSVFRAQGACRGPSPIGVDSGTLHYTHAPVTLKSTPLGKPDLQHTSTPLPLSS